MLISWLGLKELRTCRDSDPDTLSETRRSYSIELYQVITCIQSKIGTYLTIDCVHTVCSDLDALQTRRHGRFKSSDSSLSIEEYQ